MEEKESTVSGSPENTDSGSPTPISGVVGGLFQAAPTAASQNHPPGSAVSGDGSAISGVGNAGSLMGSKKKRGRPRKYDAEGNLNPAYAAAAARKAALSSTAPTMSPPAGFSLTMSSDFPPKKGRGRGATASSSPNWHQLGSLGEVLANTAGVDFTPHIITVQTGEDVAATILSFSQKGPQGICILSANGAISNVTIRQPGSSGGLLTYEGRFEILSLTGSYTFGESAGVKSRTGGLSISLAGPDGRVVGGSVAGWLIAASPIQVVVGTFMPMGYKAQKRKYNRESPTSVSFSAPHETVTSATPISHAMPSIEGGTQAGSQMPAHSQSEHDDSIGSGHNLNVVSSHNTPEWNNGGSEPSPDQRIYPDINVSVPAI